jgi:hypothetical protein
MEGSGDVELGNGVWTFDALTPGATLGTSVQRLEARQSTDWREIYGDDGDMPQAMMSIIVMRTYMEILAARPSGNVHIGQRLACYRSVTPDAPLELTLRVAEKYERNGRRFVRFEIAANEPGSDLQVFDASLTLLWAA